MLKHGDIWAAIDRLAQRKGLTASGLARLAGLDPTTFNRSKRITREGKARWPSTESIAKILGATDTTLGQFVQLVQPGETPPMVRAVPLTSLTDIRIAANFDPAGHLIHEHWDEVTLPDVTDPHAFALEVTDDDLSPVYQDGDILVLSPGATPRRGDRVLVRTAGGEVLIGRLVRHTAKRLEMRALSSPGGELTMSRSDVALLARIVWASQ
jgi:phage repressor protein C with HTH and peptisase S24 domain